VTFRDIHELLVSLVRLLLLRDLIKFITENKDSQAYVDDNMESNAVAKFFKHEKISGKAFQARDTSFLQFSLVFPSLIAFFNVFQVNSKVNKLLFPN